MDINFVSIFPLLVAMIQIPVILELGKSLTVVIYNQIDETRVITLEGYWIRLHW